MEMQTLPQGSAGIARLCVCVFVHTPFHVESVAGTGS